MENLRVISAKDISRDSWQQYVENHEYGTVFHTPYIYEVYNNTPQHTAFAFFVVNREGEIHAMLSGFFQSVKTGLLSSLSRRAVMLQAPLYDNLEALAILLKDYKQFAQKNAVYSEIRNHYVDSDYQEACTANGYKWEGHYNIIKDIPVSTDVLWKEIGRKRKDGINKAKKFNFRVHDNLTASTVTDFYHLLKQKYSVLNLPVPDIGFFHNCLSYDRNCVCKYFQLVDNDIVRVSLLAFNFKETLHALFIGIDQQDGFIQKRPVDFFYYEVLNWCVENKVSKFDWMGAGKPGVTYGVRDFKLQYGGDLVDYGRAILIHSPLKYRVAKTGLKLMQKIGGIA